MSIIGACKRMSKSIKDVKRDSLGEYLSKSKFVLLGNNELYIEGCVNVSGYTEKIIVISSDKFTTRICGDYLELCYIKPYTARIRGEIERFEFIKEENTEV